jgi:hypothetical protein
LSFLLRSWQQNHRDIVRLDLKLSPILYDDAQMRSLERLGEQRLALFDWLVTQIRPVNFKQVKSAMFCVCGYPMATD